ncbi:tRNA-dihydrouridine(20a/20b) synthase [NAD(P)+]-like protein [Cichlidogyrus casuarinus]|uniref:tRNA-dihydrouridine(20a/20b) synthase [NAD(P)+]-like protein n=1 Tax=Cichlidogyrus casuarinus TaxID=1844966 RepID=A0ABD2PVL0_9PLAT
MTYCRPYQTCVTPKISPNLGDEIIDVKIKMLLPFSENTINHQFIVSQLHDYLSAYQKCLRLLKENNQLSCHLDPHFYRSTNKLITVLYPRISSPKLDALIRLEISNNCPVERENLHRLDSDPLPAYVPRHLGPNAENLVCPHLLIDDKKAASGDTYIVDGNYTYKHYMQDTIDDKNWGCAYRSLQTLVSWLMWHKAVPPGPLPAHRTIQQALVDLGDKEPEFVGSKKWIGSVEISFCIDHLYDISCRLLPLSKGSLMPKEAAPQLAEHFACGGGPVMIGGGQLAHTIIGVQIISPASARYLILDPHYTGPIGNAHEIIKKGWVDHNLLARFKSKDLEFVRIAAPMVRYSKLDIFSILKRSRLSFRLLVRRHGVDIAYTPMIMADSFVKSYKARDVDFTTCAEDSPLVVQFASKDPLEFSRAITLVSGHCDGVDLNCGCPQRWAMSSGLGSALMKDTQLLYDVLKSGRETIDSLSPVRKMSLSAKIRLVCFSKNSENSRACGANSSDLEIISNTVDLCRKVASAGVDWITLHARTPLDKPSSPADWSKVKELCDVGIKHVMRSTEKLPIVLNGDVKTFQDAEKASSMTGCVGIMAANGLLEDPTMFEKVPSATGIDLVNEWIRLAVDYPTGNLFSNIRSQTFWMLERNMDKAAKRIFHSLGSLPSMLMFLEEQFSTNVTVQTPIF